MKPLAVDLFCGLGGWSEGLLPEGYEVVGFDVERHEYAVTGEALRRLAEDSVLRYPGRLVLQDVLTLHGSQFRNAALIVASPPCQEFSYMAMPWKRAKQIAAALRDRVKVPFPEGYTGSRTVVQLTALFDACFRIQREACEAAGRYIPLVVENVKGAQPWVGRAKANFGSFYLWGDVGMVGNRVVCGAQFGQYTKPMRAQKVPGFNFHEYEKTGKPGRAESDAVKQHGSGPIWFDTGIASHGSKSHARKAASAQIAKIPFELARYVARSYKPHGMPKEPEREATLDGCQLLRA